MNYLIRISRSLGLCIIVFCLFAIKNGKADVSNMRLNTDTSRELQNEEMIWVSPTDSNIVMAVWRDFRLGYRRVALGISTDGGDTWVDSLLKGGVYYQYSDPAIWCDRFGNFYPLTMNFSFDPYGECNLALWKTTDNGTTFSGPFYAVHDTVNEYLEDKEFMTIDRTGGAYDGNIYICWARFPNPTRIMFVRSTDGGVNWSDTLVVGSPDEVEGLDAGQFSFPLVDAFGNVYVVWRGRVRINGIWRRCQRMVKSTDGGASFTTSKVIMVNNPLSYAPGGIDIYNMCAMDADITDGPYRGNIYLAVPNGVSDVSNSPSDIIFIKSTDVGDTWSTTIRVNDEPEDLPIYQFHPWLVVNQEGVIIVFFYDQRNDPTNYIKFDSYIAFSFDGGETFTTNYRVSDISSDPGYAYTNIEHDDSYQPAGRTPTITSPSPLAGLLGEYIGISAYYDRVHCIWTDARDGDQNVYYSNFLIPFLPPRLYLPQDSSYITAQPDFKWAACGFFDEINYDLEVSTDSSFATVDYLYADLDTNFLTSPSPIAETTYFWRVKAYKVDDTTEVQYSSVRSFTVDSTSPAVPVLLSPADSSTVSDSMPEFSWSEVTFTKVVAVGAPVYYTLQISTDSLFSSGPDLLEYTEIATTSYEIADVLSDYQTYYWRVKAIDAVGNQSGWPGHPYGFWLQIYSYGDADGDRDVSLSDVIHVINYLFKGGPLPVRNYAADNNCDTQISVSDVVYLINYLFKGGPTPGC